LSKLFEFVNGWWAESSIFARVQKPAGDRDGRLHRAFQNSSMRELSGTAFEPRKLISALGLAREVVLRTFDDMCHLPVSPDFQ
jgi:hypothetical protein